MNGYNTYIGARYVPIVMGNWNAETAYEPLSIVLYEGNSYTSRTFVPAGTPVTNETYWALTGNYNAQVEQYRQEVAGLQDDVNSNTSSITNINNTLTSYDNRITTNANDINTLETNLGTTNTNVSALDGRVTTNTNDINTLESYTLQGKEVHFFGDSITFGIGASKSYPTMFEEITGATVVNHAVSGARYCESPSGNPAQYMRTQINNATLTNADYIFINCGINDFIEGYGIGTINSAMNYFKGAMYNNLTTLIGKMPNKAKLVVVSLFPCNYYYNSTSPSIHKILFESYNTAIVEVCNEYGIPVLDGTHGCGLNSINFSDLSSDGIHFNDLGYNLIAVSLAKAINTPASMVAEKAPENMIPSFCFDSKFNGKSVFGNMQTDGRYIIIKNEEERTFASSFNTKFTFEKGKKYTVAFDYNSTLPLNTPSGGWATISFSVMPDGNNPSVNRTELVNIPNPEPGTQHVNVTFVSTVNGEYAIAFGFHANDNRAGTLTITNITLTKGTIECPPDCYINNVTLLNSYGPNVIGEGSLNGILFEIRDGNMRVSGAFTTTAELPANSVILENIPIMGTGTGKDSNFRFLLAFSYDWNSYATLGYFPLDGVIKTYTTLKANQTYAINFVCPMFY